MVTWKQYIQIKSLIDKYFDLKDKDWDKYDEFIKHLVTVLKI